MSKVEVDLNQLAAAVSAAILQFAQPQPTITKKRGRPVKPKVEKITVESIDEEYDYEEIHTPDEKPIQRINNDFIAPTKRLDFVPSGDKVYGKKVQFKKKKRTNQFQDDLTLAKAAMYNDKGEKIKYPPHTEPRQEQKKKKYICEICDKPFMSFPSYIPPKGDGGHQPQIRCYNCNTK